MNWVDYIEAGALTLGLVVLFFIILVAFYASRTPVHFPIKVGERCRRPTTYHNTCGPPGTECQ